MELLNATDIQFGSFPALQVWKGSNLLWNRGFYWTGLGANDNWNTADNWNGSKAPVSNSVLTFAGTNRLTAFNNFATDTPFNSISFDSTAGMFQLSGNRLTIGAGGFANNSTNLQTINNDIKLSTGNNIIKASSNMTLNGVLSGIGSITKTGSAVLNLAGTNIYTGKTIVSQGTLNTTGANKISNSSIVEVQTGATFSIGGSETVASLEGAGTVLLGANALTVSSANTATFVGLISSTTGAFTKSGTGTQTLSSLTLGGALTHSGGTLNIFGTLSTNKDIYFCDGTTTTANISGANIFQTNVGPGATPRGFQVARNATNTGTLTITDSNISLYGGLMIGDNRSTGSNGTIVVESGSFDAGINGSSWLSGPTSILSVNGGSYGTAQIWLAGGHATDNPTPTHVFNINNGTVTLSGVWNGTTFLQNQAQVTFGTSTAGVNSNDTLNLNGGTFKLNHITGTAGTSPGFNTNTVNFNGGIYDYDKGFNGRSLPNNLPIRTTWNLVIKSGGAKISVFSGATLTMNVAFTNDGGNGGLVKLGPGTLALGNLNHSYNGSTDISAGTLTRVVSAATATFTNTTLSVNFSTPPNINDAFRFFPGSTVQSYPSISLIGAPGRAGSFDSSTSTLSIIS